MRPAFFLTSNLKQTLKIFPVYSYSKRLYTKGQKQEREEEYEQQLKYECNYEYKKYKFS